jgi:CheY-like chemotaxis protein
MKIYLTDDDTEDRLLFMGALHEIPMETEVTEFKNGVELMADLYSETPLPHLIFLDLKMPMMNGFECLADIRGDRKFDAIPVVIYSTFFQESEIEKLQEMGAFRYLQKPTSYNLLKTMLFKCLKESQVDMADALPHSDDFIIGE